MSWENPKGGDVFKDSITLNASSSNSNFVVFYYDDGSVTEITNESASKFTTHSWDSSNAGTGDFTLKAFNGTENKTISVTADFQSPSVNSFSPSDGGFTSNGDDLDVSYSSSDSHSSVDHKNISISSGSSGTGSSLTGLSLSDGSYTVDYWVNDSVGNIASGSWTFNVDTQYNGDTSPEFRNPSSGNIFKLNDDSDDQSFDVELDEADSESDTEVKCLDSSDEVFDSAGFQSVSDDGTSFTCELSADDYGGQKVKVHVEVCDEAGNCQELTEETATYIMDLDAPSVSDLETFSGASAFNSDFNVSMDVSDDASGVEKVEYYFDSDTDKGEGREIEYSDDQDSFSIDVSGLESGSKTLYVRSKDKAGRWSDPETLDFEFYPNKKPEISVDHPDNVSVTAGESTSFDLTVENSGEFFLPSIRLNITNSIVETGVSISGLKKKESVRRTVDISTEQKDIGSHRIMISSEKPKFESSLDLIVEANKKQRQSIDSKYSKYSRKLEELSKNFSELKKSGLTDERAVEVEKSLSNLKKKMKKVEKAVESGEYYRAKSALQGIESDYSKASRSYTEVRQEHRKAERKKMLMLGVGAVLLLLAGGIGFLFYSDEYDLNLERILDSDINIEGLDDIENRVRAIFSNEEEAEEFEWDGFDG